MVFWPKTNKKLQKTIKNNDLPGFAKLRLFFMVIFQNVFSPKAASRQPRVFGDPENPKILGVWKLNFEKLLINKY